MLVEKKIPNVKKIISEYHNKNLKIGFIPTMGCLHAGHLSLVKKSQEVCDKTIVSIFVNPMQFSPGEDFQTYPRTIENDLESLRKSSVDMVFTPDSKELYPQGYQTYIQTKSLSQGLCGSSRKNFFQGISTVCYLFLQIIKPHFAFFGKKDYQQFKILEQLSADLHLETKIVGCEIVRESDGLAMSSRNSLLSPIDRKKAPLLYKSLCTVNELFKNGCTNTSKLEAKGKEILDQIENFKLDYFEIRSSSSLQRHPDMKLQNCIALAAGYLNDVRLIDNIEINSSRRDS